jgi:hypothetical protein
LPLPRLPRPHRRAIEIADAAGTALAEMPNDHQDRPAAEVAFDGLLAQERDALYALLTAAPTIAAAVRRIA